MRGTIFLICITALICTGSVIGYIEYVRRDTMRRSAIAELEKAVPANKQEIDARKRLLSQALQMCEMNVPQTQADRQAVADEFTELLRCYEKYEANRRSLAAAKGEQIAPLTNGEIQAFRSSIFDANPSLEKVVKR